MITKSVHIYASGLVHCSACVPKDMPREQVEIEVNQESPTGIRSHWLIAEKPFMDGRPNPSPCDRDPERLHYLMAC